MNVLYFPSTTGQIVLDLCPVCLLGNCTSNLVMCFFLRAPVEFVGLISVFQTFKEKKKTNTE